MQIHVQLFSFLEVRIFPPISGGQNIQVQIQET